MSHLLFLFNPKAGLSDLTFDFLRWWLLGIVCSAALATLLVALRKRGIGLGDPAGVWRTTPGLLLWLILTAIGAAGTDVGAGSVALGRVDGIVMKAVDLYLEDAQTRLTSAFIFGKHHDRRDTLRQQVHDLLGADIDMNIPGVPLSECVRALRLRLAQYPWPLRAVITPTAVRSTLPTFIDNGLCLPTRSPESLLIDT